MLPDNIVSALYSSPFYWDILVILVVFFILPVIMKKRIMKWADKRNISVLFRCASTCNIIIWACIVVFAIVCLIGRVMKLDITILTPCGAIMFVASLVFAVTCCWYAELAYYLTSIYLDESDFKKAAPIEVNTTYTVDDVYTVKFNGSIGQKRYEEAKKTWQKHKNIIDPRTDANYQQIVTLVKKAETSQNLLGSVGLTGKSGWKLLSGFLLIVIISIVFTLVRL
jgi:hypothetical protein